MDFFDIEAYTVLAEAGSFSYAAKKLCVTQPALSQRIRRLEEYLGYSLIDRQRGRLSITLTASGDAFLEIAKQMLRLRDEAQALGREDQGNTLRLSINETIMMCTLPNVIQSFTREYPDVHLSFYSYYTKESYNLVASGELDVAIVSLLLHHTSAVNVIPLLQERWQFVCGRGSSYPETIESPKALDPGRLLVLCNIEKTPWYKHWFSSDRARSAIEGFTCTFLNSGDAFRDDRWAVLPGTIAQYYQTQGVCETRELLVLPQPRIIYALTREEGTGGSVQLFLDCVHRELQSVPNATPLY